MEEGKKWWNSKTVLVNMIAGLALAIVPAVPGGQVVANFLHENLELVGMIWSGLNVLLRFVTHERVKLFD